jgi:hypothetical protein
MGSPTKTVLAAATTIAIGAVVVTPLRDIQVEVSEHLLFPPEIHHTPLPPWSDPEDVFVCESRVSGCFLAPACRKPFRVFCSSHTLPILLRDQ